jgi:Pyrimidine dimer DNA glycosylase
MNVFASFPCPERSARYLDDTRVVKMTLESCQLMATAASIHKRWRPGFPYPSHEHHPLTKWAAAGRENFDWLWAHAWALDFERRCRFDNDHVHKTLDACWSADMHKVRTALPYGSTPFVNCARNMALDIDYTHVKDVHKAYRLYLRARYFKQLKPAVCSIAGVLAHGSQWRDHE